MNTLKISSPIGELQLVSDGQALVAIHFPGDHRQAHPAHNDSVLTSAATQLAEYFAGQRRAFALPLAGNGTPFQQAVWKALHAIPHGELRSYRDIASAIGRETAVRAVGAANGRNPLPIVVPCHRVIGSDGSLTGYAGGLTIKRQLLALEGIAGFA
ncbi:methylated-DNA--[protein]-cysteine S-methyltransferase [Parahaliea aestuarii]|uniref:Methylated-DNA--protein-cysteine methyltransferase n=1 Tax=Parahaliea aestuarii TaxID=1852021 RepID=A0A5C9A104_9GAMM|nr:methylated-DNA--[protein]-cysteine S-methyltransferase [Parahaliea aestuarii]TXS94555.1 methylated-DNA--[protein]-cysteine S-methyltransferase [Parahaliea aestuarii]